MIGTLTFTDFLPIVAGAILGVMTVPLAVELVISLVRDAVDPSSGGDA